MRAMSLVEMSLLARQMTDTGGQENAFGGNSESNVEDSELTAYFNLAVPELWNILLSKAPENWNYAVYYIPVVNGVSNYVLPADFQNILGVDVFPNQNQTACFTIDIYDMAKRNKYSYGLGNALINVTWSNIKYQLQGNTLNFIPPQGNLPGTIRILYQQAAPILCANLPIAWAEDATHAQGDLVSYSITPATGVATSQTFVALNGGTSGGTAPSWNVPGTTTDNTITWAYKAPTSMFATTFDGISGFEIIPILECAMKIGIKQEMDVSAFAAQKQDAIERIKISTGKRRSGEPDALSPAWGNWNNNGGWGGGNGSFGV